MKLGKTFWITFVIGVVLFLGSYDISGISVDRCVDMGFPFKFYFSGGWCSENCVRYEWKMLAFDVLFLITIPVLTQFIVHKISQLKHHKS